MLGDTPDESTQLRGPKVWIAMFVAMSPIIVVGLMSAPFATSLGIVPKNESVIPIAQIVVNCFVLTHYFCDAFIYRFRILSVRQTALRRLRF